MSGNVMYTSHAHIERIKGPLRSAQLPASDEPIYFGVHSEIAEHYGVDMNTQQATPTTLDHVVAAAGG